MIAIALNQISVCIQSSTANHLKFPTIKKALQLTLVFGFLQWMIPVANALQEECPTGYIKDPLTKECAVLHWCPYDKYWDQAKNECVYKCSSDKIWDDKEQDCIVKQNNCNSSEYWNGFKCIPHTTNPDCGSDATYNSSTKQCDCRAYDSTFDPNTKTCKTNSVNPPDPVLDPNPKPVPPNKKYKNQNLRNCLEGASEPTKPQPAEFDCVPTPQNEDGSLSNADDKDYTKWSDDLYPGKSKAKPITGFYSKKLVRCDNATAASEECPIAVKAKFVITCKTGNFYWKQDLGRCTIASKIRTFYATYQAFLIPGQKPIKANIVGDSTNSNTPATAVRVEDIVGAGEQ